MWIWCCNKENSTGVQCHYLTKWKVSKGWYHDWKHSLACLSWANPYIDEEGKVPSLVVLFGWSQADLGYDFSINPFLHEISNVSHFASLRTWPQTFSDLYACLLSVTITGITHLARLFSCFVFLGFEYLLLWTLGLLFCLFTCLFLHEKELNSRYHIC